MVSKTVTVHNILQRTLNPLIFLPIFTKGELGQYMFNTE